MPSTTTSARRRSSDHAGAGRTAARTDDPTRPLVLGSDPAALRQILTTVAAAGIEPEVVHELGAVQRLWRGAPMVLVASDLAAAVAELALPRRAEVFLVGDAQSRAELEVWSGPLGAAVVVLPQAAGWLTTAVADVAGRSRAGGEVLAVVGGSGGAGVSTFAAALAVGAAAGGRPALLVDLDPLGAGADLLLGAEDQPGWRWPRLTSARDHVADLADHLPRSADVAVLATARGAEAETVIGVEAVRSVLTSAARHHGLVVVDLPRGLGPAAGEALRWTDRTLLVTGSEVRAIAGSRLALDRLRALGVEPELVVRRSRGALAPPLVAEALGLPLLVACPDDPGVARSEAAGEPPGRSRRSPLGRAVDRALAGSGGPR